jgi:hypothetical protein
MSKQGKRFNANSNNVWIEVMKICLDILEGASEDKETRLLNFWTYRGGGKTTFLDNLKMMLALPDIMMVGLWDVAASPVEEIMQGILHAVNASFHTWKVVLLDNLDHLLRIDDGTEFFEFEHQLVLPLLERDDVLLITTSQIPIYQWREYDVRIHQENHLIRALNKEEVACLAETGLRDATWLFEQSLGYPQILSWLQQEPQLSEVELAQRVSHYFLSNLSPEVCELASVAALLPSFDIAVLRDVLPAEDQETQEGLYSDYVGHIRELIAAGLVAWDMHIGAYHFPNSTVRRLLARSFQILRREDFVQIHEKATTYYQAEARHAGYLHYMLVSALYHMAYSHPVWTSTRIGDACKCWLQDQIPLWTGADWPAVLQAWQRGAGDEMVNEELQRLLGIEAFNEITQILASAQHVREVAR